LCTVHQVNILPSSSLLAQVETTRTHNSKSETQTAVIKCQDAT